MERHPHSPRGIRAIGAAMLIAGALLLQACATTEGPKERMADRLAFVERFTGPPVDSFHFWDMKRFEVLGEHALMVWTTIDDAYLITVERPCNGLVFARGVGLSSTQRRVHQRFDTVNFDNQRCDIAGIRPVDGDALRDAQMAGEYDW